MFVSNVLVLSLVALGLPALSVTDSYGPDPCQTIAGKTFVPPSDALACMKSFPFNETLRQNVLTNVACMFDFFTFEDFYLNLPAPFQESTTNILADLARMNITYYTVLLVLLMIFQSNHFPDRL